MNTNDYVTKDYVFQLLAWLYEEVWMRDIPQPGASLEYQEHHRDMQYIMKCIKKLLDDIRSSTGL